MVEFLEEGSQEQMYVFGAVSLMDYNHVLLYYLPPLDGLRE